MKGRDPEAPDQSVATFDLRAVAAWQAGKTRGSRWFYGIMLVLFAVVALGYLGVSLLDPHDWLRIVILAIVAIGFIVPASIIYLGYIQPPVRVEISRERLLFTYAGGRKESYWWERGAVRLLLIEWPDYDRQGVSYPYRYYLFRWLGCIIPLTDDAGAAILRAAREHGLALTGRPAPSGAGSVHYDLHATS